MSAAMNVRFAKKSLSVCRASELLVPVSSVGYALPAMRDVYKRQAKEDAEPEEKFVPKTYNGKMPKAGKVKKDKPKKAAPKPAPKPANRCV